MRNAPHRGFTLIEILVVIGIIAILAAIVIIAINPAKQFAQARNTQRQAGVSAILNAIGQRMADNKGTFSGKFTIGISPNATDYYCPTLPAGASGQASIHIYTTPDTSADDLSVQSGNLGCLVPTYIASLPLDPDSTYATSSFIGYDVGVDNAGRVTVCANRAAIESSLPSPAPICITR